MLLYVTGHLCSSHTQIAGRLSEALLIIQVGVKGQPPVLDGELHDLVNTEDCFWNISDGKLIEVTLQKVRWPC